jgi:hypothetical protein
MNVDGTEVSCTAGATCSGTAASRTITYTKGSDWDYSQTVPVGVYACDAAGNCMTDNTTFTTAVRSLRGPPRTKAEGLTYSPGAVGHCSRRRSKWPVSVSDHLWELREWRRRRVYDRSAHLTAGVLPGLAGFDFSCYPNLERPHARTRRVLRG